MHAKPLMRATNEKLPPLLFGGSVAVSHTEGKALSRYLVKNFGIKSDCGALLGDFFSFRGFVWDSSQMELLALSAHKLRINANEDRSGYLLIPLKGCCVVAHRSRRINISEGSHACLIPKGRWQIQIETPFSALMVRVNQETLAKINHQDMDFSHRFEDLEHRSLKVNAVDLGSLIQNLGPMINELLEHPGVLRDVGLDRCLSRILSYLLRPQAPKMSTQSDDRTGYERIASICRYIDSNLGKRLTINDLEELSDLSARTIQYQFQKNFGCTPKRYILNKRLKRARELLIGSGGKRSVTQVATALMFSNLGNFSRSYLESFGELPSQTLVKHSKYIKE